MNEEILEELKAEPTSWPETKKIQIKFATKSNNNKQQKDAKKMLNYRPNGRRRLGRPLKRMLDRPKPVCQGLNCDEYWLRLSLTYKCVPHFTKDGVLVKER
jgi:hypothetical protein